MVDTATSKTTVNLVIIFLGAFSLGALALTYLLVDHGKPAAQVAIISGAMGVALGGLVGVLASTRSPVAAQIDAAPALRDDRWVPYTLTDSSETAAAPWTTTPIVAADHPTAR